MITPRAPPERKSLRAVRCASLEELAREALARESAAEIESLLADAVPVI
jgi:hypothetical protein